MRISMSDIAFRSYELKATQQTLEKEISFKENITQTDEVKGISYHTTTKNDSTIATIFKDPTNGKSVIVSLEEKVIEKLSNFFGDDTIVNKSDGTIKLSGEAEEFVSGWFGDIAYAREFLKADRNKDGKLNEDEILNIKNSVEITVDFNQKGEVYISDSYTALSKEEREVMKKFNRDSFCSLDEELNMTLQFDVDFDGKISLNEVLLSSKEAKSFISLENLEDMGIESLELSMKDLDKLLSIMEYLRKLFLKIKLEKELIEVVDNSFLHKILKPEEVNKILTEELFDLIVSKNNETKNIIEDDDFLELSFKSKKKENRI